METIIPKSDAAVTRPGLIARGNALVPVMIAIGLFALLWFMDFPKPMQDDLFYTGAGLNLASGGDYSNPLLARQGFPSHFFFVYPPLHSYALAGWLRIFGIHAASMLGFQAVMYLIISVSTIALLRRYQAPAFLQCLVPLGVTAHFMTVGLRTEPFAVALTMAGYALFEYWRGRGMVVFLGFLLMFLGASAAPRTAFFAGVMALLGIWWTMKNPPTADFSRWRFCGMVGLAFMAATLVFLLLIHFKLGEFLSTFRFHSKRSNYSAFTFLADGNLVGPKRWPLLALAMVLVFFSLRYPFDKPICLGYFIVCIFPLLGLMGWLWHGALWYAILVLFLTAASMHQHISRRKAGVLLLSIALVLAAANITWLTALFGIMTGKVHQGVGENRNAALSLQSTQEHPLLVDASAARYVFDYRLPPGTIDWGFSAHFPGIYVADSELHPGDIFVVGPPAIAYLNLRTHLNYTNEHALAAWRPFGANKLTRYVDFRYPREVFIIPAADCKGIRTEPSTR